MARNIKICAKGSVEKWFEDEATKKAIKCAFNLNNDCTPNCAACCVYGVDKKAECTRGNENDCFLIGRIKE